MISSGAKAFEALHLIHHAQSMVNGTLVTVLLYQRGEGNDDKLNGRLLSLFDKRRRAMHDIALGTGVKAEKASERLAIAKLLRMVV